MLLFIGIPVYLVVRFDYYIDPLWNFEHENEYNDYQLEYNERLLKTNYMNSRSQFDYNGLLIGTSRVTYMNQNDFQNKSVFNYSASNLHIDDYLDYIDYVTEKNGHDFTTIYMELYVDSYDSDMENTAESPQYYFEKSEAPFYRYTSLFSYNTWHLASVNHDMSAANEYDGYRYYDRHNVAYTNYPPDDLPVLWNKYVADFNEKYSDGFNYDPEYKERLMEIKEAYPNTRFVVFTNLIPYQKLSYMLQNDAYREGYERWYHDMVDVFGKVYSFQGKTPLSTDMTNFFDWGHYYPEVGTEMIHAMEYPNSHEDIMTVVTNDNVDDYLNNVVEQAPSN